MPKRPSRLLSLLLLLTVSHVDAQGIADTPAPPSASPPATVSVEPGVAPPAPPRSRVVKEIIVTAQRKEESLREVPISISVLDEDFLSAESISGFREISRYVPNVTIDDNATFADIRIRGFGSPLSNRAFEQPVGLVIDGVPYGRLPYWQGPLYDLQRVEVLRGPQGTLFGKNTTAGLFNVVTRRPTDALTGSLDLQLGELDRRRVEAALGGPIISDWRFRIAGLIEERDGTTRNTTAAVVAQANPRMNDRDRKAVRVQIAPPQFLGLDLVLSYEKVEFRLLGSGWELDRVNPDELPFLREYDPGVDTTPSDWVGSIDHGETATRSLDTMVANATYSLGEWTLYGVLGHSTLDTLARQDVDFTPAPMIFTTAVDSNPQTTVELRASSPSLRGLFGISRVLGWPLGTSEATVGCFYQRRSLQDVLGVITLNVPVLAQFLASQSLPGGGVPPLENFVGPDGTRPRHGGSTASSRSSSRTFRSMPRAPTAVRWRGSPVISTARTWRRTSCGGSRWRP